MKTSHSGTVNINKSNLTLWKNQNLSNHSMKEDPVENEYIENLKKQAYLMEMELNLMKEREREIEKTGGFSKINSYHSTIVQR